MRPRNVELRVGVLVIVAIVAITSWLLFLKEFKFNTASFPVIVDFPHATGLKAGAGVDILGVNRGKVRAVELLRDRVRVELEVEAGTFLSADTRFQLVTDLFNPTVVRIVPGSAMEALDTEAVQPGDGGVDLGDLMRQSAGLVSSMASLTARLDSLSADGRLDRLAGDLEAGVRELRDWTAESRRGTREVLEGVDRLTANLNGFLDETRQPAGETLATLGQAAAHADSLSGDLARLTRSLTRLSEGLESGEGSLGRALNSPVLHDSVLLAVSRLDSLISEIKANPKKFVHFSLF